MGVEGGIKEQTVKVIKILCCVNYMFLPQLHVSANGPGSELSRDNNTSLKTEQEGVQEESMNLRPGKVFILS